MSELALDSDEFDDLEPLTAHEIIMGRPWRLWEMGKAALVDRLRALHPRMRKAVFDAVEEEHGIEAVTDLRLERERFWYRAEQLVGEEDLAAKGKKKRTKMVVFVGNRGDGKTQGAIHLFDKLIRTGVAKLPRVVCANAGDVSNIVIHGPSGILSLYDKNDPNRPVWLKTEKPCGQLRYSNGVSVRCFSAEVPRGTVGQAGDVDLYDDLTKWAAKDEAWDHARTSCREGIGLGIVATSAGEGEQELWALLEGSKENTRVLVKDTAGPTTTPPTRPNIFNLSCGYYDQMADELGGTEFYRREMLGEKTSATSPFTGLDFDSEPIRILSASRSDFTKVVVAVDPAEGKGGDHDEWGIGAAGIRADRHIVALDDVSGSYDDDEAADEVIQICDIWRADEIVVETNRGKRAASAIRAGFNLRERRWMERKIIAHESNVPFKEPAPRPMPRLVLVNARDNKVLRAGPLRLLYKQNMLHHVVGLYKLEKQQREWKPHGKKRPRQDDRIDWLVHAVLHLAGLVGDKMIQLSQIEGLGEAMRKRQGRDREKPPALIQSSKVHPSDPRSTHRPRARRTLSRRKIF